MPRDNEGPDKFTAPSGQDINPTAESPAGNLEDGSDQVPLPPWRQQSAENSGGNPEDEDTSEQLTRTDIINALGRKFSDKVHSAVIDEINNNPKYAESRRKILGMSGMGKGYDADESLLKEVEVAFEKLFPMSPVETSSDHERSPQAPTGVPSTEEAVRESRIRTGVRSFVQEKFLQSFGFAGKSWNYTKDIAKDMGTMAAGGTVPYYLTAWAINKMTDRQEKQREKYKNMSEEEKKRAGIAWAGTLLLGAGAAWLTYRFGFDAGGSGGSGASHNGSLYMTDDFNTSPHPNGPHGDLQYSPHPNGPHGDYDPSASPHPNGPHGDHKVPGSLNDIPRAGGGGHEALGPWHYNPDLDPARSGLKHGNDWGPAVQWSPEDGAQGKPAGYTEFFDKRIHQSPKEFSATLSEFGLNGKSNADIKNLADQMQANPKLAQEKYDALMKTMSRAKVYEITYDGDYGSYYAVKNPDGTVTLSYDDIVAGKRGNKFIVFEIDGVKHYGHPECGMQWSHFNPDKPQQPQVQQQYQVKPHRQSSPVNHPPRSTPPSSPPPSGPPSGPPPSGPPSGPPPVVPPPDKTNHFPHPGDGTFRPAPAHTTPAGPPVRVEQRAPGSASSSALPGTEHGSRSSSGVGGGGAPSSSGGSGGSHSGDAGAGGGM